MEMAVEFLTKQNNKPFLILISVSSETVFVNVHIFYKP